MEKVKKYKNFNDLKADNPQVVKKHTDSKIEINYFKDFITLLKNNSLQKVPSSKILYK
jgi:hypothetical protein